MQPFLRVFVTMLFVGEEMFHERWLTLSQESCTFHLYIVSFICTNKIIWQREKEVPIRPWESHWNKSQVNGHREREGRNRNSFSTKKKKPHTTTPWCLPGMVVVAALDKVGCSDELLRIGDTTKLVVTPA